MEGVGGRILPSPGTHPSPEPVLDDEVDHEEYDDLNTRLTYLEAFSIACFIMLKERLRRDGEDETRFGAEFQTVFREAMRFLNSDEEEPEDDWRESLDGLIRRVENGDDLGTRRT